MSYLEKFKNERKPVLVQFWAEWCAPCRMLRPIVDNIERKADNKLLVDRVNIDQEREIAMEFDIRSIPTLMLVKEGNIIWQNAGLMGENDLTNLLEETLSVSIS